MFRKFLEALATPGGNLFILCVFDALLLFLMAEPGLFKYSDDVDKVIQTMFAGFSGATLQALTSGTRFTQIAPQNVEQTELNGKT